LYYPVVYLSQFATSPATIHYDAVYGIFQYLSGTCDDGITYTRPEPMTSGPVLKHTPLLSQPTDRIDEHVPMENLTTLYGYSEADWDMHIQHRRSISGTVLFLAGARLGLFIRAVLTEILQPQHAAMTVYEDNDECRMVADSTAPTCQIRHIPIHDLRSKTGQKETLYHSQPVPRMPMHRICLPSKLTRLCLPAIMITFPAVPHSFGLILTFSMSPDLRLEPGGCWCTGR
jgi:hypothetical protein